MRRCGALALLSLAACGGLATPELGTGALAGRLHNASVGAYVYPLGRPELVVHPAADGSYTLPRVPVETRALVVVDGAPGSWRATLVDVTVASAALSTTPELDAATMPLAGRVGVVARLAGGSESTATRFTAVGTDRQDIPAAAVGVATVLDPLPAGTFELLTTASGFADTRTVVTVVSSATTVHDVRLPVDADDRAPGCAAAGAACRPGLVCDVRNGSCYECLSDADCAGSATGNAACVSRVCVASATALGTLCERCTADAECASGVCAVQGFCTRACTTDAGCPAAFACVRDGARDVCATPAGCEEAREEVGSACFHDAGCAEDLARGLCAGARIDVEPPVPGFCTGRCDPSRPDDCALFPGHVCSPVSRLCEKG